MPAANTTLYRSRHGWWALLVVAGAVVWGVTAGSRWGSRDPDQVVYLLTTGWVAVVLFVVLALYAARKAAHRTGLSPEFRRKLPLRQLEQAATALQALENDARSGRLLLGRKALRGKAVKVLREHGVNKVVRPEVRTVRGEVQVRALPRNGIGRLAAWMHAHIYYGLAAAVLVFCHGGGRTGSTMGLWLNLLSLLVIGSGIVGLLLWTFGPAWLTGKERELSVEQGLALDEHYARKLREALLPGAGDKAEEDGASPLPRSVLRAIEAGDIPSDRQAAAIRSAVADPTVHVLLAQRQRVGREWQRLRRARSMLGFWRIVHVPLSVALLALVAVHIVSVWTY